MSRVFINDSTLTAIADAIRQKNGTSNKLLPSEMAAAIRAIITGGGETVDVDELLASIADGSYSWGDYIGAEKVLNRNIYENQNSLHSYTNNNLTTVNIEKSFDANANLTSFIAPNLETLGGKISAFGTCPNLINVNLGNVKELPNNTFWGCTKLPYVPNADILTYIGRDVFRYNDAIESIDLPKCEKIEGYAFNYMTALRHVNLPSIKRGERNLFSFSHNLETLDIGDKVTFIDCYVCFDSQCQLDLTVRKPTPPELNGPFFFAAGGAIKSIKVPAEAVDAYKAAANWSNYAPIISAI